MTVVEIENCACGQPATRTLGARPYCDECAEQVLGPIRAKHPSNGQQVGPLRPDYGKNWAELGCTTCGMEWVGMIGEPCSRCMERLETGRKAKLALAPPPRTNGQQNATQAPLDDDPDDILRAMLIHWPTFWAHDHADAEWLAEPVLPAGRSVALFAPGGTGKSLLALWLAATLASGTDPFTGRQQKPVHVLYLDYEMTESDLSERLEQMGFGDVHLSHLHYALLPSLPGLDQPDGGKAVVRLAELVGAQLVVIDTFGRAVHGDENDADTVRAWYRWTGLHLKAAGRAFMRVDHAGKDKTKGQRGTSGKNDDVDVVWELTAKDAGAFTLSSKWKRRMSWVPLTVDLIQTDEPLAYQLANGEAWPAGTKECALALDGLGLANDVGVRPAAQALRNAGHKARQDVIRAAVKYRKRRMDLVTFGDPVTTESAESVTRSSGNTLSYPQAVTPSVTDLSTSPDQGVTPSGNAGNSDLPQMGNSVCLSETHAYPADDWEAF